MANQFDIPTIVGSDPTEEQSSSIAAATEVMTDEQRDNPAARVGMIQSAAKSPIGVESSDDGESILAIGKKRLDEVTERIPIEDREEEAILNQDGTQRKDKDGGAATGIRLSLEEAQEAFPDGDFTGLTQDGDEWIADSTAMARMGITGLEDEGDEMAKDVEQITEQAEDRENEFLNLNIDTDPAFIAQSDAIKAQFGEIRRKAQQINKSRKRSLETLGYRTGATQFAGAIQLGILGEELSQANARIAKINAQESAAIMNARTAFENNEYVKFSREIDIINGRRDRKVEELNNYNQTLLDYNEKLQERQDEFDKSTKAGILRNGILTVLGSGVTDPLEILAQLELSGIPATPEDVTKYTSLIENQDTLANLDPDYAMFTYLQENNPEFLEATGINSHLDLKKANYEATHAPASEKAPQSKIVGKDLWERNAETGVWEKVVDVGGTGGTGGGSGGSGGGGATGGGVKLTTAKKNILREAFTNEDIIYIQENAGNYTTEEFIAQHELKPNEAKAFRAAMGVKVEEPDLDADLKAIGFEPEDITAYRQAQSTANITIKPEEFLKERQDKAKAEEEAEKDEKKAEKEGERFITVKYLVSLGMKEKEAKEAMTGVESRRTAGFTDKEIFKEFGK